MCGHAARTLALSPVIVACGLGGMVEPCCAVMSRGRKTGQSMSGKVVVITGANTGVGRRTAHRIARLGGEVILACRDPTRGERVRDEIRRLLPHSKVTVVELDLASAESVRDCARALPPVIDVLILNAGINANVPAPRHRDFGCSTVFGVNFVAHWLLCENLLRQKNRLGKVVCVASVAHHFADPAKFFDDDGSLLTGHISADYAESKLAMILYARSLNERGVDAVAVNPGAVSSEIWRHVWPTVRPAFDLVQKLFFLTADEGAATSVAAASDDNLKSGYLAPYWQPSWPVPGRSAFEFLGPFAGPCPAFCRIPRDEANVAAQLWRKCTLLCTAEQPEQ